MIIMMEVIKMMMEAAEKKQTAIQSDIQSSDYKSILKTPLVLGVLIRSPFRVF